VSCFSSAPAAPPHAVIPATEGPFPMGQLLVPRLVLTTFSRQVRTMTR
jgi:hypothetical protein